MTKNRSIEFHFNPSETQWEDRDQKSNETWMDRGVFLYSDHPFAEVDKT